MFVARVAPLAVTGILLTNVGLLAALISSPNLGHANPAVQYGGVALMALGLGLMAFDAIRRRRDGSNAR